jgi:thiosulfate/3-mercaptopyruvate sulfurtransferase
MNPDNPRLLKSDEEIAAILKERGITRDKTIICSCGTGREATCEFLLFRFYLKFPKVRIYEGSFTEWTACPDNPVVTGKSPRKLFFTGQSGSFSLSLKVPDSTTAGRDRRSAYTR